MIHFGQLTQGGGESRLPVLMTKLDIGGGEHASEGWTPWDIKRGRNASHLEGIADASVDVIRASHVLEHLPRADILPTLQEWARALKLGGELLVAVPDFDRIVQTYQSPSAVEQPVEGWLLGSQNDEHDFHRSLFNRVKLTQLLGIAGFEVVSEWRGDDSCPCASSPCSLNLRALKRNRRLPLLQQLPDTCAVMSLPRVAWTETMASTIVACKRLSIDYIRATGVFWGQCMTRSFEEIITRGEHEWILTIDYDSVFDAYDIARLREIAEAESLDIICPFQIGRDRDSCIMLLDDGTGQPRKEMPASELRKPYLKPLFGHFGLTLIRVSALQRMARPWFHSTPDEEGRWSLKKEDDDIRFWRMAREADLRLGITPQVRIGHLQLVCTWCDDDLQPVHQYLPDYAKRGRP